MAEVTTPSGLKYEDLVEGTGDAAKMGETVSVHYTGWLTDGKKFDSSKDRGQPFPFSVGCGTRDQGLGRGSSGHESRRETETYDSASVGLWIARRRWRDSPQCHPSF